MTATTWGAFHCFHVPSLGKRLGYKGVCCLNFERRNINKGKANIELVNVFFFFLSWRALWCLGSKSCEFLLKVPVKFLGYLRKDLKLVSFEINFNHSSPRAYPLLTVEETWIDRKKFNWLLITFAATITDERPAQWQTLFERLMRVETVFDNKSFHFLAFSTFWLCSPSLWHHFRFSYLWPWLIWQCPNSDRPWRRVELHCN